MLVNKEKKCVVEATFDIRSKPPIVNWLKENDHDEQDEIVIRREISPAGKSRAFVNDTPVILSQLTQLSSMLVDLHQQFDTMELVTTGFQREVMDALAGNPDLLANYFKEYTKWKGLLDRSNELKERKTLFEKEYNYNAFQLNELSALDLKENELEQLEEDIRMFSNSETIKNVLTNVYQQLNESDEPIVQRLKVLSNQLGAHASSHKDIQSLVERLRSSQVELQDIADESGRLADHVTHDAGSIEQMQERLSEGYRLQKKHGVRSTAELIELRAQLEKKLKDVLDIDDEIKELESAIRSAFEQTEKLAVQLSERRKKQVKPFEQKVNKLLVQVGMPNARLKVEMEKMELSSTGFDRIDFLFNANLPAGSEAAYRPLSGVASGGELSRLMLCIKSLVAKSLDLPTMIFDEIDTGISGEAAKQVGIILKDLSRERQVICITHQPQIAGKADLHFFVYKEISKGAVRTAVRKLTDEERITTIAQMLSGEKPSRAAMENARELVK